LNFNATLNLLENMGENIRKISDELKQVYSDVNWPQIKGFRNRVVHDYINIDTFMVYANDAGTITGCLNSTSWDSSTTLNMSC